MAKHFADAFTPDAGESVNQRRFTGATGRAAAKAKTGNWSGNRKLEAPSSALF